jgi:hypothetical protein
MYYQKNLDLVLPFIAAVTVNLANYTTVLLLTFALLIY